MFKLFISLFLIFCGVGGGGRGGGGKMSEGEWGVKRGVGSGGGEVGVLGFWWW